VEGRFLQATALPELESDCRAAGASGVSAVILADGPLGDAVVLAAALGQSSSLTMGILVDLTHEAHRHPTVLARELTTLDHVCPGRTLVAFSAPHGVEVHEAIRICRAMWRNGDVSSVGPIYPVPGAINLPIPPTADSPKVALDLRGGGEVPAGLRSLVDYLLLPTDDPAVCLMQPT
jgi:alkanesulfonate monooxygenase SsuD/methylene tetrahydromethanopterin reductase-like flavin-dependent oxidoreductase (luciferase family)